MPEPSRPLKVFLCHAHADRDPVRGLYTRLTQDGVDAWLDKAKLLPGQDWELEIRKAVREADVVVVCLSKQFNQAGFRQKEVKLALDTANEKPEGEIFIIPARLEECDNLESLRKWHWVDLFEDDGYEMLMRALRTRAEKIGATLQIKRSRSPKVKMPSEKNVSETNSKKKNGQEMRMFYDLAAHFECDIENTTPETLANFLLESLTRIMRTVSVVNKSDDNRTVEYRTDQIEYFDPKHGKTIQHALIVHGKKLQLIGKGDFRGVESLTTVLNLLVITITQGVNGSRLRFDSDNIPIESFKELVQGILWDFGKDISVLERAEREAAEKVANEKAEKEAVEKVRLEAEELVRQKFAKEKAEREAAETAHEKAMKVAAEKARLEAEERAHIENEEKERKAAEVAAQEKEKREAAEKVERKRVKKAERDLWWGKIKIDILHRLQLIRVYHASLLILMGILAIVILLSVVLYNRFPEWSQVVNNTRTATATLTVTPSRTSEPSPTPTKLPTLTPTKTNTPTVTPPPTLIPPSSILFQENFEDGAVGKLSYKYGNWIIEREPDGNHYWSASGSTDYPQIWYGNKNLAWTDYAFENRVKFVEGLHTLAICIRADVGKTFYAVFIDNSSVGFIQTWSSIDAGVSKIFAPNRWYTIRVEIKGDLLSAYIDNDLVRKFKLQSPLINQGGFGYVIWGGEKVYFDDIKVWSLK